MKKNKKTKIRKIIVQKKEKKKSVPVKKDIKLIERNIKPVKQVKPAKAVKEAPVKAIKSPFSKSELEDYKEKLLNLKDDVIAQIHDISETTLGKSQKELSGDISGYSLHIADVASDNYDRDFNLGLVSGDRKIAMEIDEAIKKIEEKTFGICEACKKPIIKTRLNAIPYAKLCIKCKEIAEKNDSQQSTGSES